MSDIVRAKKQCQDIIEQRIRSIESLLMSAKACLKGGDYFQAIVRLEESEKYTEFSEEIKTLFEYLSE